MEFTLNGALKTTVEVTTSIDSDGDILISIAGVEVGYIKHSDGVFYRFSLYSEDLKKFEDFGIATELDGSRAVWKVA